MVAWTIEEAEKAPVYYIWEDLHSADPSSLEGLPLLLDQVPATRLLAVLTFRPQFRPPWPPRSHITQFMLTRLGRREVEMMVERMTAGKPLPVAVMQEIVSKTDGVPLFVEELTRAVMESGLLREQDGHYELTSPLNALAIPSSLNDSLMARLDRLGAVEEVAQLAATVGRGFSYELLEALAFVGCDGSQGSAREVGRIRHPPSAWAVAAGAIHLPACPNPGCGLSIVTQEHAAAISQTYRANAGGTVSGDKRNSAGTTRSSLY